MKRFNAFIHEKIEGHEPHIRVDFCGELSECDQVAIKTTLEKLGDSVKRVNMNISKEGKYYAIVYIHPCADINETLNAVNDTLTNVVFN